MAKAQLSVLVEDLSGKAGSIVFVSTRNGVRIRPRLTPADPRTPKQLAQRARVAQAAAKWKTLTPAQIGSWARYAAPASANAAFVALSVRFLCLTPAGSIPTLPPATPFQGDHIQFSADAKTGKIAIDADNKNEPGVYTEFLVQKLPNLHRRAYPGSYRHAAFVQFTKFVTSVDLPLAPGIYALAYRYIRQATGQSTGLAELGVYTVG